MWTWKSNCFLHLLIDQTQSFNFAVSPITTSATTAIREITIKAKSIIAKGLSHEAHEVLMQAAWLMQIYR